ncbi:MAG: type II secretion system protein [Candidatus Acidiferrales bacterium]
MRLPSRSSEARQQNQRGLTLLELVVATAILLALATMALPMARVKVKRDREIQLRWALREMRSAIDRYKDASDRGLIEVKAESEGYPESLEVLVEGVQLAGKPDRKVRFLRRIPVDPMTGRDDWNLRCIKDPPDSRFWCGENVFDVSSRSIGEALDGSSYADW